MAASAVVAIVFFGVSSFVVDRIIAHTVRENARKSAAATARVTFAGMYQLMSTGWSHDQAGHFIASIRAAGDGAGLTVQIYRGPVVERNFGPIVQPPMDESLHGVLSDGRPRTETVGSSTRYLKPLVANERCPVCHTRARPGDVLGVIEVKQDDAQLIAQARREFGLWLLFLAPLAMSGAALVVWRVNRRIEQSIAVFDGAIAGISAMSDLRKLEFAGRDLGFEELNRLFGHLGRLVDKLRAIAVDKDVLRFEIGLLEKFVITSEVVRDWGEYVSQLLVEINRIMTTHVLFSLFKIDDAAFDLEVFWARRPSARTRAMMEDYVRRTVAEDERFGPLAEVHLRHREPQGDSLPLDLDDTAVTMQTKALILDKPKIGGIVGIGVNSTAIGDDTIRLVMDSVLSTMLNVIGSVKAIHKYTGDMEYFATRDPLTDLFNRRVFWELLEYEEARARRHGYEFGILVIDLDSFKLINDTHGHMIGDRYLQAVARAMKGSLRPGDILGRYGGDEFVVLLPETGMEGTTMVARRLLA